MDLDIKRYETFEQLELYCHRVASVVGLLSIEIFGYQNPACRDYAVSLGKALQLTNILRDVRTDAERGRIYLPLAELAAFGVTPDEILRSEYSERYRKLAGQRCRARPGFLPARPQNPARRRSPVHGRRRIDGLGLLAAAAQIGSAAVQRLRPAPGPAQPRIQNRSHSSKLVAVCRRRNRIQLWTPLKPPLRNRDAASSSMRTISAVPTPSTRPSSGRIGKGF